MTDLPELIILDVGHGNCAVLRDTNGIMVIDCAPGSPLLDTLYQLGINEIACVLISHADYDHIGGLTALLTSKDVRVRSIYLNPDPLKGTDVWQDLRHAVKDSRARSATSVNLGLTTELSKKLNVGEVEVEILAPNPEIAMSGVGGKDLSGRRLDANSMSVVVGLIHSSYRAAVLAGDIDQVGLDNLLESSDDLAADILVFPHHGGSLGNPSGSEFSQRLCSSVAPRMIVFSIGRGRFDNPRREVIEGVRAAVPDVHILCTQLSQKCAAAVPDLVPAHLTALPAKGKVGNGCCGGTVVVRLRGKEREYSPTKELHTGFVGSGCITSPQCLCVFKE